MIILGIETSCDETACGIVEDGTRLLSNVVATSMDLHAAYGGVVPEIAARSHIESIIPVIEQALDEAFGEKGERRMKKEEGGRRKEEWRMKKSNRKISSSLPSSHSSLLTSEFDPWDQIDGIAVTYGAGLGGSLLVGVMTARTLAITKNKPLYAINHVEGHIYANFLTEIGSKFKDQTSNIKNQSSKIKNSNLKPLTSNLEPRTYYLSSYSLLPTPPAFPMLGLIVSGGHSQLVLWRDHFDYTLLGQTYDDAIGEAFDKVAKMLGLPYPGGPSIGKKALEGDPFAFAFPKAKLQSKYDFSFSGIKTAVLRAAQTEIGENHTFPSHELSERLSEAQKANIAASFQRVAIETVVDKTILAFEEFQPKSVVIGGGVAASPELRRQLAERLPIPINYQDPKLMTDNGAMIATLGCYHAMLSQPTADPYTLEIAPNLSM